MSETATRPPSVTIRDRRELPFFQVRLAAIKAIRGAAVGPRRVRAIGLYGLLSQLANEQRHTGEHRTIRITHELLARRAGTSKRTIKLLLDALQQAEIIRYERLNDPVAGTTISLLHLLVHEGPWTAVTVAMADHLATERCGGHLLRDLGLMIVYLEFCSEQRTARGGLSAEVLRCDIAEHTGLTTDRIDGCNRLLEQAGLLQITRRRATNGGRHLASLYTIHEAPAAESQGRRMKPPGPQNETDRAAEQHQQGGVVKLAGPQDETDRAAEQHQQGGNSGTVSAHTPPSIARAGDAAVEKGIEETFPSKDQEKTAGGWGRGELSTAEDELCEALLEAWKPALGVTPRRAYRADPESWRTAARELLDLHPRSRLQGAFEYMVTDEILGSRALTMPGFAKVADQLIARDYARRQRRRTTVAGGGQEASLGWPQARQQLERAIQRYGRDNRDEALQMLSAASPLFVPFVERVRWSSLCEQPLRYAESRYADIWRELNEQHGQNEEAAA